MKPAVQNIKVAIANLSELRRWETDRVQGLLSRRRKKPLAPADRALIIHTGLIKHTSLLLGIEALELIQDIRSGARHPESVYLPLPSETQEDPVPSPLTGEG